jgi:hypothetical protein
MRTPEDVIASIRAGFAGSEYPGDPWLQGSNEGCEPAEEVGPFVGRTRWEDLEPAMLDGHYCALSFFSEAGFRFFLPAYLVADVRDQLLTADPLFHLTGGFHDGSIDVQAGDRTFVQRFGGSVPLNPLRYGAIRFVDYARFRLSVFTREEAGAIVSYLEYKRDQDSDGTSRAEIDSALDAFWRDRAAHAPTGESLRAHLASQRAYVDALRLQAEQRTRGDDE